MRCLYNDRLIPVTLLLMSCIPGWGDSEWNRASEGRSPDAIAGAALAQDGALLTWGAALRRWNTADLSSQMLAAGPFGEGGCVTDLDLDGASEFVSVKGGGLGTMVWLSPPDYRPVTVDSDVDMHDCLEATLFGRRGVLMIQRGMQVRFYQRLAGGSWTSRDIYSIYTPSYQSGLGLADVDGDGRIDIFCGNYWIESPATWQESWRLFAINTWFEEPESASMRLAVVSPLRIAAVQAHMPDARAGIFSAPADVRQLWDVAPLAPRLELHRPHGLASFGDRLLVGEHAGGQSRLMEIRPGQSFRVIAEGHDTVAIVPMNEDEFLSVTPFSAVRWSYRSRR